MKKPAFDTILDDVQRKPTKDTEQLPEAGLNFKIPGELKKKLDRAVYHKGPKMSQRLLLVQMLTAALNADADAAKPLPGE
jgi:hypothetical protein